MSPASWLPHGSQVLDAAHHRARLGGNRTGENLRGPRAVERTGLGFPEASCRSSDVCTRFYSFKTWGNISLHLGPAVQGYLQTPNLSLPFFALLPLPWGG